MRPDLALASALLVGLGVLLTPDYRLLGGLPLACLMLWIGARTPSRIGSRNDISYGLYIYGFPVQQALVMWGFAAVGWLGFAVLGLLATLPIAALSWLVVERPSLRWKSRLTTETPEASERAAAVVLAVMFVGYYVLGTFRA